jgi:hypothetical protein
VLAPIGAGSFVRPWGPIEWQPRLTWWLRPIFEGADDFDLDQILELPEAKQVVAAWGVKNDVAALARGGKIASWLVGALRRRGLT